MNTHTILYGIAFFLLLSPRYSAAQAAPGQNTVSFILARDTMIIYKGVLTDTTRVYVIPADEDQLQKTMTGISHPDSSVFILKPVSYVGFVNGFAILSTWLDARFENIAIDSLSTPELQRFHLVNRLPSGFGSGEATGSGFEHADATILVLSDSLYYYRNKEIGSFKKLQLDQGRGLIPVLTELKRQVQRDSITINIKPTDRSIVSNVADVVDEIFAHRIHPRIDTVSTKEQNYFHVAPFFSPSEPVPMSTPVSVTSPPADDFVFHIELKKDITVWYTMLTPENKPAPAQVKEPVLQNLKKAIALFKQAYPDQRLNFLIQAYRDATYPQFETIVTALRENEIYKYNLMTAD